MTAAATRVAYFKRYKMEADLDGLPPPPRLPPGLALLPWDGRLLDAHSDVLYASFVGEVDSVVFPSLGDRQGCRTLMMAISRKRGFLAAATWLLTGPDGAIGTVQGVRERAGLGAIQNLGVLPAWRGRGVGTALLVQSLYGFRRSGLTNALLEVTATNGGALRLYRRVGFRCARTLYKAVPDPTGD
jgi:ribosomal protein S18 acetylase RimI-like enzyme